MSVRNVIQAAAGAGGADKLYVEDVFSTYLYTGNNTSQTITNGIDLSGEGGMVWTKSRSSATWHHVLIDTLRGTDTQGYLRLFSTLTLGATGSNNGLTAFNSNGYSVGASGDFNNGEDTFVSWTFRKTPKFFDVVTYTGNGTNGRQISHSLGSTPGCVIVKRTDTGGTEWLVYHRSVGAGAVMVLNTTDSAYTSSNYFNAPSSTYFSVQAHAGLNASGGTYVAYLFAHDAGGFGLSGTDNVISCGSYTGNGSATGPTITLGYEPQWVLIKQATDAGTRWTVTDNMRGFPVTSSAGQQILQPNVTDAEVGVMYIQPTATGFKVVDVDADVNTSGKTYIYIAIRRGPMKTPEVGTDVFTPALASSSGVYTATAGFPVDMVIYQNRASPSALGAFTFDRLRGSGYLGTTNTSSENSAFGAFDNNLNFRVTNSTGDFSGWINWLFRRAPGFFDVVCYTGTGSATTVTHNLSVAPELIIVKPRDQALGWPVWNSTIYAANADNIMYLNETGGQQQVGTMWNSSSPTSTTFPVGTNARTNGSAKTFVAYLFASCPGVSKIGSVSIASSGTLNVDCGFTAGARFVLLKKTDSASPWLVFDTARGIVAGDDPYLGINTSSAENFDGSNDNIDPYSLGFSVPMSTFSNLYGTGNYIYLAIA